MRAGLLRQRVSVRRDLEADDGHQGFTTTTVTVRTRIAAEVTALVGRELERAQTIDPRAAFLVRLRYWRTYAEDLIGGRCVLVWHDGIRDRELEAVAPPRETVHRVSLELTCKELA